MRVIFGVIFIFLVLMGQAQAACTINFDPINYSYDAGGAGDTNPFGYGTWNANIICPSGQSWQLIYNNGSSPTWLQMKSASNNEIYVNFCKSSPCSSSDIYGGTVIASGVGTGSTQVVTLYTRTSAVGATCTLISGGAYHSCKVDSYPLTPGWQANAFKLIGDNTVYASPSGSVVLTQSCLIYSTGNLTINYNGSSDATGSFAFSYTCGEGSIPINLNLSSGNNPSGELRRAAYSGGYIGYRLYQDSGYSQEIGVNNGNNFNVENYSTKTIYAKIFRIDNPVVGRAGAYNDTIVITLTF